MELNTTKIDSSNICSSSDDDSEKSEFKCFYSCLADRMINGNEFIFSIYKDYRILRNNKSYIITKNKLIEQNSNSPPSLFLS